MWFPWKELSDATLTAGVCTASILLAAKQMQNAIFAFAFFHKSENPLCINSVNVKRCQYASFIKGIM